LTLFPPPKRLWFLLILLVAGAAAVWLPRALNAKKELLIPVEPAALSPGLALATALPKNVEIRVKGPKSIVSDLSSQKIVYRLDLSGVQSGIQTIQLQKEAVCLPANVSVDALNPSYITVQIDLRMEKRLPVVLDLVGKPTAGFYLAGSEAIPPTAVLSGAESLLAPLTAIRTQPIEIDGAAESFQRKVPLDLPELVGVDSASKLVTAGIVIAERIETRVMAGLPITGTSTTHTYRIAPPTLDLTLKGPARVLDKLQFENRIKAYVDLKGLKPGVYRERATISLPVTVTVVAVTPERFTVELIQRK
jgi:YbbR domain-containing protein